MQMGFGDCYRMAYQRQFTEAVLQANLGIGRTVRVDL